MVVIMSAAAVMIVVIMIVMIMVVVMMIVVTAVVMVVVMVVMVVMVVVIMVVMIVATTVVMMIVVVMIMITAVMVMVISMFFKQALNLSSLCQCMADRFSSKFFPWCRDDGCFCIFLTKCVYTLFYLFISHHLCTAHNNCRCMLYLVFEEFSKVLHVHLRFFTIYNSDSSIDLDVCIFLYSLDCSGYIG